jgi:hypothetical protein
MTHLIIKRVSEWLLFNANSAISWQEQINFQWDDDEVRFVLDQHAELDFHSEQQSMGRHVTPLWHIIPIPSQPVFALSPSCCVLSGEARNTNFIVFGLTRPGLEPTICRTQGKHTNHYSIRRGKKPEIKNSKTCFTMWIRTVNIMTMKSSSVLPLSIW